MSLIQEALKRKQEENPAAPPPSPADESVMGTSTTPPNPKPPRGAVLILVILLLCLLGYGAYTLINSGSITIPSFSFFTSKSKLSTEKTTLQVETSQTNAFIQKEKKPVKWPKISFEGIATGGGKKLAILNGRILSPGKEIDGARIVKIETGEVTLEYKGEQKIFSNESP